MNIDLQNLFDAEKIASDHWEVAETKLPMLLERVHARKQGFYTIFEEESFQEEVQNIQEFAKNAEGKWTDIVLCGIGGSALGPLVLQQAFPNKKAPELHVLENIDPDFIQNVVDTITLETTLFIVVSKSGGTAETVSQYLFFSELLTKAQKNIADHMVIITGNSGFLREEGDTKNLQSFSVPENIGGRFSVLSAVGLLPAALLGIDIAELIQGGRDMAKLFCSQDTKVNLPFQFAMGCYLADEPIHVFMPYSSRLRNLGSWYAQLLAESTGKNGSGFTMLPSLGATDQHSQLQLFSDGPADKLIIFLEVQNFDTPLPITSEKSSHSSTEIFQNISFQDLILTELKGTRSALQEKEISNCTLSIDSLTPHALGQLFVLLQGSTAFLGEMLGINAFDQPGVERSKEITRELLSKK